MEQRFSAAVESISVLALAPEVLGSGKLRHRVGPPPLSIDFRRNANVLTALQCFAKPKQRTPTDPYVVDGYELHASPELASTPRGQRSSTLSEYWFFAHPSAGYLRPRTGNTACISFCRMTRLGASLMKTTESHGDQDMLGSPDDHLHLKTRAALLRCFDLPFPQPQNEMVD